MMFYIYTTSLALMSSVSVIMASHCHNHRQSLILNTTSPCQTRHQLVDLRCGDGALLSSSNDLIEMVHRPSINCQILTFCLHPCLTGHFSILQTRRIFYK